MFSSSSRSDWLHLRLSKRRRSRRSERFGPGPNSTASCQRGRLLTHLDQFMDRYGQAFLHGAAAYKAEGLIGPAGWTGRSPPSGARTAVCLRGPAEVGRVPFVSELVGWDPVLLILAAKLGQVLRRRLALGRERDDPRVAVVDLIVRPYPPHMTEQTARSATVIIRGRLRDQCLVE